MVGDVVFLDSSRLRWLLGNFKSKQSDPYLITQVFPNGAVELETKEGVRLGGHPIFIFFFFFIFSNGGIFF